MLVDLPVEDRYVDIRIDMPPMVKRIREHPTCLMQKRYANVIRFDTVSIEACGYHISIDSKLCIAAHDLMIPSAGSELHVSGLKEILLDYFMLAIVIEELAPWFRRSVSMLYGLREMIWRLFKELPTLISRDLRGAIVACLDLF